MRFLHFWLVVAYGVCLMPGPGYWDKRLPDADPVALVQSEQLHSSESISVVEVSPANGYFRRLFCEDLKAKGWWGHFLPMVGITFCIVRILHKRKVRLVLTFLMALLAAGCIALSIELLQETLPSSFCRGFAWADIGVALTGALTGITASIAVILLKLLISAYCALIENKTRTKT